MKERIKSIDSVRTVAILAVILIHTTTRTLEAAKYNLLGFPVAIFLNQAARFAVPLFFLISGLVLEISWDGRLNYFSFLKKRLGRIFIPYVFWSLVYYFFVYSQNHNNFLRVILTGDASYQLYFIPTLCIFYLVFPLLHKIYKFISNIWILVLLGGLQTWLLYQDYLIKQFRFADPVRITILAWFFFLIGMVVAHNRERIISVTRKLKYIVFPLAIVSGIFVYRQGVQDFLTDGSWLNFYSQWRPSVMIYTILIGLVFFFVFENLPRFTFFEKLSKYSFLVFFIHVALLEGFWSLVGKNLFNALNQNLFGKITFDVIFFGVISGVSFLTALILHKIPKLNKITG